MIAVIGNIAAGKTTFINKLMPLLDIDYKVLSIDNYRAKYNKKRNLLGEKIAWMSLISDAKKDSNIIFESSGTSKYYNYVVRCHKDVSTILIDTDPMLCIKRHSLRMCNGYILPPYPLSNQSSIQETIYRVSHLIRMVPTNIVINSTTNIKSIANQINNYEG